MLVSIIVVRFAAVCKLLTPTEWRCYSVSVSFPDQGKVKLVIGRLCPVSRYAYIKMSNVKRALQHGNWSQH